MIEQVWFDQQAGYLFYGVLTLFNLYGYEKRIPLIQLAMIGTMMMAIVPFLTMLRPAGLVIYGLSTLLFCLFNICLFIVGMLNYRKSPK
jgi:membrane protein insertase Oxa1/YidC/SpoIIIJ